MKITDCRIGEKIPLSELKVGGVFFWDEGGTLEGCKFYQRIRWDTGFSGYVLVARLCDGYGIALLEETKIIPVDAELILTPFSGE